VRRKFEKAGVVEELGEDAFFWSADQAILKASDNGIPRNAELAAPAVDAPDDDIDHTTSTATIVTVTT